MPEQPDWTFEATSTGRDGTIQSWEVPATGYYGITAYGAEGGPGSSDLGGKGAKVSGTFSLTGGQIVKILVGQQGIQGSGNAAGGGGGTFVAFENAADEEDLLLAAGGGGGGGSDSGNPGVDAITPEDAGVLYSKEEGEGTPDSAGDKLYEGDYGTPGHGARDGTRSNAGGGGGGFLTSGDEINGSPGDGFLQGGLGAQGGGGDEGGFGGGGATPSGLANSNCPGGGGGGYSGGQGGGAASDDRVGGGGGGSYNNGTDKDDESGVREGHGLVEITDLHQPGATFDPSRAAFKTDNPDDVTFDITWDQATEITNIAGEGITSSDWSVSADVLTINQSFLETFTNNDLLEFTVEFDEGDDVTIQVVIVPLVGTWQSLPYSLEEIESVMSTVMDWEQELPTDTSATVFTAVTPTGQSPAAEDWVEQPYVELPEETLEATGDGATGEVQEFVVPESGTYTITAYGAEGGGPKGGKGAKIQGEFALEEDDVLKVVAGHRGLDSENSGMDPDHGSGGGCSFVAKETGEGLDLLVIAGGGGAAYGEDHEQDGRAGEDGGSAIQSGSGGTGSPGTGGDGGTGDSTAYGGAGWNSGNDGNAGAVKDDPTGCTGADYDGGFGGGGSSNGSGWERCAGGGGYSGGAGARGTTYAVGGGGGSYNDGAEQNNEAGVNDGDGYVHIAADYDPDDPEYDQSVRSIDEGENLTENDFHIKVELETKDIEVTPSVGDMWFEIVDEIDEHLFRLEMYELNAREDLGGGRFNNVIGDLTVDYDGVAGDLVGDGGGVESFLEIFTPTDLEWVPDVYWIETINATLTDYTLDFIRVYYVSSYTEETLSATLTDYTLELTHIEDLDP